MKLSSFSEEEEVLFLPLSCFEVVNIENEDFFGHEIKVIRLRYLNKYKKIINDNFEEILKDQKGLKLEEFIKILFLLDINVETKKYHYFNF